jgi:hypothetical protein
MGPFRSIFFVAALAVGCGGRTSGSSGGSVTGSLVGSTGLASGSGAGVSGGASGMVAASRTSGAAACEAAGGQCVAGVAFCANVGPGATAASCLDVRRDMLCCALNEDAGCTEIQASSYDQSCKSDSDCVKVDVGNACVACVFACGQNVGAINAGAMAQYTMGAPPTSTGADSAFRARRTSRRLERRHLEPGCGVSSIWWATSGSGTWTRPPTSSFRVRIVPILPLHRTPAVCFRADSSEATCRTCSQRTARIQLRRRIA